MVTPPRIVYRRRSSGPHPSSVRRSCEPGFSAALSALGEGAGVGRGSVGRGGTGHAGRGDAGAPGIAGVGPPPDPKRGSGLFAAAEPAKVAAIGAGAKPAGGDSKLFLDAVRTEQPRPAAAAPAAEPAAVDLSGIGGEYPGDDAPKQQIAAWMAKQAEQRGLPPQLPVMAALVESNLTNVNYGDADSLGYFQMRVSIWNRDYPGFADDPKKQVDWFLDTAERVKEQRVALGKSITDPDQFGEWIADVERPAEQYRGRYQLKLGEANALLEDATPVPAAPEAAPAAPKPAPAPAAPAAPIDPDQFGQDGTGGKPDAEAQALLKNENVVLDDIGVADIKAGRIDPRIVGVLTKLSQDHKIVVSCMCSDHPRLTTGGSVSNHTYGRGLDIASIDGEIVSPGSALAREVASELSQFDPAIRPDEIGSPFAISAPGYFTDAAHSNHIHVGFKQAITPDWKPPPELSAQATPAEAAAAGTPGADAVVDAGAVGPGGGGQSSIGAAALRVAQTQRGVREIGSTNTGPQVDQYLDAAGVAPGNPWCAGFLTWSLQQAGHRMPGGGWAGVATWVRNAEQSSNGLTLVSAEDARPGDIVAYDWGGGNDFGADGHIGFLASSVRDGQFTALEGNNADAVNVVPRRLGGANIVFIRVEGNAPAGAAPAATPAVPAASVVAGAPAAGVPAAAPEAVVLGKPERTHASGLFQSAQAADAGKLAAAGQPAPAVPEPESGHDSILFLKAVEAQQQQPQPAQPAPAAAAADPAAAAVELSGVGGAYPGDDAPREQIAAWMAKEAERRGLPPQLPVMAALVESNLTNVNYGDADSLGYFQMRVSIWNRDYPGFADDPKKQIDWFLDTAERVKEQRVALGKSITDPDQFGEWIADVERPAEDTAAATSSSSARPTRCSRKRPTHPRRQPPKSRRLQRRPRASCGRLSIPHSSARRAVEGGPRRRRLRCSRTRTSCSTPTAGPTSGAARWIRAWSPC